MTTSSHKTELKNRPKTMHLYTSSFTGKERDEETGYGYFGARYMDYELTTMWLSVDPMADKYPSISPYAYCMWNPIKVVDPNGMDTAFAGQKERELYLEYRDLVFSDDEKYGQIQKELIQMEQASEVFCIRMGENITSTADGGNFKYNNATKQFDVNIRDGGDITDIQILSHELKHVDQYLNRKLTLLVSPSGHTTFSNYSIDDELEAYYRQGMFGNTWTNEEVFSQYRKMGLVWHGHNSNYKPSDFEIQTNLLFQENYGHPRRLYHGWEDDINNTQIKK